MIGRVGFIHTVGFLVEDFRGRMRDALPDVDTFHILNESLLQDLLRGRPKAEVHRRVTEQVLLAIDAGADLVVMTCSSTSPGVDTARQIATQPILKIDDAMAARAVSLGRRIGLVCTATSTVEPSTALLQGHAAAAGYAVAVTPVFCEGAYPALMNGDRGTHDAIVRKTAAAAASDVDVLVLAQASLAPLREALGAELPVPVLASPDMLMADIVRRCEG